MFFNKFTRSKRHTFMLLYVLLFYTQQWGEHIFGTQGNHYQQIRVNFTHLSGDVEYRSFILPHELNDRYVKNSKFYLKL